MFTSQIQERSRVQFPLFTGERHYMVPFFQKDGLPDNLSHWQKTVDNMLEGVFSDNPIYFMAEQSFVKANETQRRPGVHVDGYWNPSLSAHRGRGHDGVPSHRGKGHGGRHMTGNWDIVDFSEPEALLLASDVSASRAFIGEYAGPIKEGGDASDIDLSNLLALNLQENIVYCGTVGTLHESLPVQTDCYRTLVRLNCPGVTLH